MVKLRGRSIWEVEVENNDSWMWKVLLDLRLEAKQDIEYKVRNGNMISVWYDKWNDIGHLCQFVDRRDLYNERFENNANVAYMISNNQWAWHEEWNSIFPEICNIQVFTFRNSLDKAVWRCNDGSIKDFLVKQTWKDSREINPIVRWMNLVWFSQCIPSHTFFLWMAIQERLQT
nr:hypothetical protein [Tanacetum cinerariifolium]